MSVWSDWRALRAFKALPDEQRRIVVYSESGQDWHHFEPVIAEPVSYTHLTLPTTPY